MRSALFALVALLGLWARVASAQSSLTVTASSSAVSSAGGTITFTVDFSYPATATSVSLKMTTPSAAWTYVSASGTNVPQVVPQAGDTGNAGDGLGFVFITIPSGRASFTFTLKYPAKLAEDQSFTATGSVVDQSGGRSWQSATVVVNSAPVGPAITTQPADIAAAAGSAVTFSVVNTGTAPITYKWRKAGVAIDGATDASFTIASAQVADSGYYDVVISNSVGAVTSRAAKLTVSITPVVPVIGTPAQNASAAIGGTASFSVTATAAPAPTYQWQRRAAGTTTWSNLSNSTTYSGATTATLSVKGITAAMNGDQFRCVVTNSAGSTTGDPASLAVAVPTSRLTNLSVRASAGAGDQTLIVGFVTAGSGSKQVVIRGIGPSLAGFGVSGVLADPVLKLYDGSQQQIDLNDDWGGTTALTNAFAAIGAFSLPANAKDAALLRTLPAGAYTAQVSSAGSGGVVLVEAYDADAVDAPTHYSNLSARNQVGTGDGVLIAGFVVTGSASKTLLIRGVGPTLAQFGVAGVLANPKLALYNGGTLLNQNDDWGGSAALSAAFTQVGAFSLPATSKDAALLVVVQPGSYTAQVSGVGGTTGVALVEVYEINN